MKTTNHDKLKKTEVPCTDFASVMHWRCRCTGIMTELRFFAIMAGRSQ